jgi:hypothetical protein
MEHSHSRPQDARSGVCRSVVDLHAASTVSSPRQIICYSPFTWMSVLDKVRQAEFDWVYSLVAILGSLTLLRPTVGLDC